MSRFRLGAATLAACVGLATGAAADEIVMHSGTVTEGVIVEETDTLIQVRTALGVTGIAREFIAEVRRATPEANAALEAGWRREAAEETAKREARRAEREAKKAAARAYAAAQRAMGLVLYDGEWLPRAEAELRVRREQQELEAANHRRIAALQEQAREADHRAAGLEEEIARLNGFLRERDARIATLDDDLAHCEYNLHAVNQRYAFTIHDLQRRLAACRGGK